MIEVKCCDISGGRYEEGSLSGRVHAFIEADESSFQEKLANLFGSKHVLQKIIVHELYNNRVGVIEELETHFEKFLKTEKNPISSKQYKLWERKFMNVASRVGEVLPEYKEIPLNICRAWYRVVSGAQYDLGQWIYKGNALDTLARYKFYAKDRNTKEYMFLSYIEDVLITKYRD